MKKSYFYLTIMLVTVTAKAQVPYFAGTVGDGKLYGYSSIKIRNFNIYLWGNDFFKDNPRWVVGVDFAL